METFSSPSDEPGGEDEEREPDLPGGEESSQAAAQPAQDHHHQARPGHGTFFQWSRSEVKKIRIRIL